MSTFLKSSPASHDHFLQSKLCSPDPTAIKPFSCQSPGGIDFAVSSRKTETPLFSKGAREKKKNLE